MKHSSVIGIDISDVSIKVLQLDAENTIVAYGSAELPKGTVEGGNIVNTEVFSETLRTILTNTSPLVLSSENATLRAIVCLPESKLFTHYLTIPQDTKEGEVAEFVRADAEKIIPFELRDLYWDYHIAEKNGKRNATFVGVSKSDLNRYVAALVHANVKPAFVGGELFSLGRALLPTSLGDEDYIIVDMGAHTTTIGIFGEDAVANVSVTIPKGGEYFTKRIAEKLAMKEEEAEVLKCEQGLDPEYENTGVRGVLLECIKEITDKIAEAKTYFEEKTGAKIAHIILTGGSASLKKLDVWIQEQTGIPTEMADPLSRIKNADVLQRDMPGVHFSTVVGLALHGVSHDADRINLLRQYQYEESDSEKFLKISDIRSLEDLQYVLSGLLSQMSTLLASPKAYLKRKRTGTINFRLIGTVCIFIAAFVFLVWVVRTYIN